MWLGIRKDLYSNDNVIMIDILQGLIISPLLIVAYCVIIHGIRGYYTNLLQKYDHEYTQEERDSVKKSR